MPAAGRGGCRGGTTSRFRTPRRRSVAAFEFPCITRRRLEIPAHDEESEARVFVQQRIRRRRHTSVAQSQARRHGRITSLICPFAFDKSIPPIAVSPTRLS